MNKSVIVAFLSLLSSACETWPVLDSSSLDASLDLASNPSDGSSSDMSKSSWTDTFDTKASTLKLETSTTLWSVVSQKTSFVTAIGFLEGCNDPKKSIAVQDFDGGSLTTAVVGIFKEPIPAEISEGTITIDYLFKPPANAPADMTPTLAVSIELLDSQLNRIQPHTTIGNPLTINSKTMSPYQKVPFSLHTKTLVRGILLNVTLSQTGLKAGSCVRIYKLNLTLG